MLTPQGDSTHDDYVFKIPSLKQFKSSEPLGRDKKEFLMGTEKESPYFQRKGLTPKYSPMSKLDISGAKSKVNPIPKPTFNQMPSIGYKLQSERVKATSIGNLESQVPSTNLTGMLYSHRNFESEKKQNGNNALSNETSPKTSLNPLQSNFENFVNRFSKLQTSTTLPNHEAIQHSLKSNGLIKAFAVCTNIGLVRNYNEDRVTTMVNIVKPMNKYFTDKWPNCSIFGIFDGHGGARCADFLKDNLHHYIIKSPYFPLQPVEALKEACQEADKDFMEIALAIAKDSEEGKHDRSGSCGVVVLTIDNKCYVCNIGDSRGILSRNMGAVKYALTRDHKPCDEQEKKRIFDAGGKIYQSVPAHIKKGGDANTLNVPIPYRISPGRLAISRAFGDIEAKMPKFGGNPNVLVSHPEITSFSVDSEHDFVILGCDGIFDVLSNDEVIEIIWNSINQKKSQNIHEAMKIASEEVVRQAMLKKSLDNVTALVICFSNLDFKFVPTPKESKNKTPSQKDSVKIPLKWENSFQENDRVTTPIRTPTRHFKQINKGRSQPLPGEDGSPLDESQKLKSLTPHKPIVSGNNLNFGNWEQNKQGAENDIVTFRGLPKISKIRTPR